MRVWGLGFGVWGLGFGVESLGCSAWDEPRSMDERRIRSIISTFAWVGSFQLAQVGRVQGAGCRVQGSGFRVQGSGFRVQGSVGLGG